MLMLFNIGSGENHLGSPIEYNFLRSYYLLIYVKISN